MAIDLESLGNRVRDCRSRLALVYDVSIYTDSPLTEEGQSGVVLLLSDIVEELRAIEDALLNCTPGRAA